MKPLLGGKGANLAEMTRIGLPVPPGFTITTEVCTYFYAHKKTYPKELQAQMEAGIANMEKIMGTKFGDANGDAVARGRALRRARFHARHDGHDFEPRPQRPDGRSRWPTPRRIERFAWDCYRRFIQMYGDVVHRRAETREGEDHEPFETVIHEFKHEKYHEDIEDSKLTAEDQEELVKRFKALVKERTGKCFRTIRGTSCAARPAPCSVPG